MKLDLKAFSISAGIIWAAAILLTGAANLFSGGYGKVFLEMAASVYPGYDASGGFGDLLVGTLYGFVDGLVFGALIAWLYNRLAVARPAPRQAKRPIEP